MRNIAINNDIYNSFFDKDKAQFNNESRFLEYEPDGLIYGNSYIVSKTQLGGFIDLYKVKNEPNTGTIVFGVHPFMRGRNLASIMIKDIIDYCSDNKIRKILVKVNNNNYKALSVLNHTHYSRIIKSNSKYTLFRIKTYNRIP